MLLVSRKFGGIDPEKLVKVFFSSVVDWPLLIKSTDFSLRGILLCSIYLIIVCLYERLCPFEVSTQASYTPKIGQVLYHFYAVKSFQ